MQNTGMTLIEMAIVLAICGILAALGGASFYSQASKQRVYAMKSALLHLEAEQANQLLLTKTYSSSLPEVSDRRFSVYVVSADSHDFVIKAVSHVKGTTKCDELIVTSTSRRPDFCWE